MRIASSLLILILSGCVSSPIPTLSPWPFKEDQIRIACEQVFPQGSGIPSEFRVFVYGSDEKRYAANQPALAVAPYMTPLLAVPDRAEVARRQGIVLCKHNMEGAYSFRRPSGLLGEGSWIE